MKNSCYWALTSVHQIIQMLKNAGFSHVIAEDRTDQVCPSFCAVRTPMLFSTRTFGSKSGFDDTHQCSVLHSSSSGFYRRSWINLKRTKTVSFLTSARWFGKGLKKFRDELAGSLEACLHSLCSFQLLSISNSELSPQKKKNSDLFVHSRSRGTMTISWMDGRQNCRGALLVSRGGACSLRASDVGPEARVGFITNKVAFTRINK